MIRKRYGWFLVLIVLFMIGAGCSNNETAKNEAAQEPASSSMDSKDAAVETTEEALPAQEEAGEGEANRNTEALKKASQSERKVIFNGEMTIEVEALEKAQSHIQKQAEEAGGYIVNSSVREQANDERRGRLTARVPQEHFSSFLDEVEAVSKKVVTRSTHGNDVTEEYVDLESRLRSKEAVEERLLTFMEEAGNTEDLLNISKELAAVQEEMERLQGRINYLDNHVAYSTVTIQMEENAVSELQDSGNLQTWSKAKSLFMNTVNALVSFFSNLIVFVIGLSPVLVPLLIILVAVFIVRKRNAGKKE